MHFDETSCWNWVLKKVDQTTTTTFEPAVGKSGIEDQLDIQTTSDS